MFRHFSTPELRAAVCYLISATTQKRRRKESRQEKKKRASRLLPAAELHRLHSDRIVSLLAARTDRSFMPMTVLQ